MRIAIKISIAVFFSFCYRASFAQKGKIDSLERRVAVLEDYKANIQQLYQINEEKLGTSIDAKIDSRVKDIKEEEKIILLLLWIGLPTTIIGAVGLYFKAISKAKKLVFEKIETIVQDKERELVKLIESQEFDNKLRLTKKLIVLSTTDDAQGIIKKFFPKFQFKNVHYRVVDTYTPFPDYDLVIFNNSDGSFAQELIDAYIQNSPDDRTHFVAYTIVNLKRDAKINFANSSFTLYHNILSTLKYAAILEASDMS